MWAIAIGIAIGTGFFVSAESAYLDRMWNPLGTIVGGLIFGYGMALSGNCGYGALARLGCGDLRSFVIVLVMGLSAYFVMSGPLAHARVLLFPVESGASSTQGFTQMLSAVGVSPLLTGLIAGGALLVFALSKADIRSSHSHIFWGFVVGFAVVSGWVGTYWVAMTGFESEPIETHTFVAPIGDTIF